LHAVALTSVAANSAAAVLALSFTLRSGKVLARIRGTNTPEQNVARSIGTAIHCPQ